MRLFRMLFKPVHRIGTCGDCLQSSFFQLICKFDHQFSCDSLAAERSIYKCVVHLDCTAAFVGIRKCDLCEEGACF